MKFEPGPYLTAGTGILFLGIAWLIFWLGPAFHLYQADPRWAHNFAFAVMFITVGIAAVRPSIASGLIAVIASFATIPTELAYWSGMTATMIELVLLALVIIIVVVESRLDTKILTFSPRTGAWLNIHLLVFAYLGLAHMPFVFFVNRWSSPLPYMQYLPIEHEYSTTIFNAMLLVLVILAIAGKYTKTIGNFDVRKAGFYWALLMLLVPLVSIGLFGQ